MKTLRSFWLWASILFVSVFALGIFMHKSPASADTVPSFWLDPNVPTLAKLSDLPAGQTVPFSVNGNRDCQQRKIITRAAKILPVWPYIQTELSSDGCAFDTAYGALDLNNNLQRQGSSVFGRVLNSSGGSGNVIAIPHSTTTLQYESGPITGLYFKFIQNFEQSISSTASSTGETIHKIIGTPGTYLQDKAGHKLAAHYDSLAFSGDSDWMVVDLPGIGLARIDLHTFDVLPFGEPINYNIGLTPSLQTAISSDGRYAVEASIPFNIFKLYDLSTCAPVPDVITSRVVCQSINMLPIMQQKVPGYFGVSTLRFHGDYALDLYVVTKINNVVGRSHQVLTAAGQTDAGFQYLALGDSFASGEGAFSYKSFTDVSNNKCHLSQKSYPYLIGSILNYDRSESIACSGAKIEDIVRVDDDYGGQVHDGNKRGSRDLQSIIHSLAPGYIGQIEFLPKYIPKVITISTVGNDVGFKDKIQRCLDTDTCFSTYEDRLEIVNEINAQFYHLTDMYKQLKEAAAPDTKIYVIGYPILTDPDGNCALNVHMNHDELVLAGQLVNYLNQMVKTAAAQQGVFYVDVEHALDGHRLCETDSWNVAVNGLTAGNDIFSFLGGPIGNESFHPNAFGHELFKNTILEKTNNLSAPMPDANPTLTIPNPVDTLPILQAPKANRTTKIIKNVTGTNGGVVETGKTWATRIPAVRYVQAGLKVKAWLNSDPYYIGEFPVNDDGSIDISFTLPNTISGGFHTLHLYGVNTSNEDVDLYQTIYVSDGTTTSCGVITQSGQDVDQDGIDDACDPFIDQAPSVPDEVDEPTPPIQETLPSEETENPQVTTSDEKMRPPETAEDEKPLENNPETVAGNEQLAVQADQTNNSPTLQILSANTQLEINPAGVVEGISTAIIPPAINPTNLTKDIQPKTTALKNQFATSLHFIKNALLIFGVLIVVLLVAKLFI